MIEVIDRFCHLGDMLGVDGSADAAVTAIIQCVWSKFRQLSALLKGVISNDFEWLREIFNDTKFQGQKVRVTGWLT